MIKSHCLACVSMVKFVLEAIHKSLVMQQKCKKQSITILSINYVFRLHNSSLFSKYLTCTYRLKSHSSLFSLILADFYNKIPLFSVRKHGEMCAWSDAQMCIRIKCIVKIALASPTRKGHSVWFYKKRCSEVSSKSLKTFT